MTSFPMSGRADAVNSMAAPPGPAVGEEHGFGVGPAIRGAHNEQAAAKASWPLRSHLELGALPSAVPCARLHAKQVLWEWQLDDLAQTVELIVSELVTNGLQASTGMAESHYQGRWQPGTPPVRLALRSDRRSVLVQVWDANDQTPERREPDLESVGGRGLLLVETLSAEWGTYTPRRSSGKVVWALITR
jgi:hypothetical protein